MILSTIRNYYAIIQSIPKLIEISGYRNDFLASKIGMRPETFSAKKVSGNWSEDELTQLLKILSSDDVEDYYLGVLMEKTELNADELVSLNEFKKMEQWK